MKKLQNNIEITEIIPISRKIGKKEALNAIRATQNEENLVGKGGSGSVYIYRQKYVVKISHKHFEEEVKALQNLDSAISEGLDIGNSQRGIGAFKTNEDDIQGYIISTYVQGSTVLDLSNPFLTKKHFDNVFDLFLKMDLGTIHKNNLEILYIFLHYDLGLKNILLTDNEANLVDFEMLKREDLDICFFKRQIYSFKWNVFDDTVTFPCNMRLFEICFLWLYIVYLVYPEKGGTDSKEISNMEIITKIDKTELKEKINKTFNDYLLAKSEYLMKQSELHKKVSEHQGLGRELLKMVANEEMIHSKLISPDGQNVPDDIRKAEMYKIQLANFYFQIYAHKTGTTNNFSIIPIIKYHEEKEEFYNLQLESAKNRKDAERILYYTNCIKFLNKFKKIDIKDIKAEISMCNLPTLDEMIL